MAVGLDFIVVVVICEFIRMDSLQYLKIYYIEELYEGIIKTSRGQVKLSVKVDLCSLYGA